MQNDRAVVYCDGACSGNPGPGGWAYIVTFGEHEVSGSGAENPTTNNRMELVAAIEGITSALERFSPPTIRVVTDSQYVKNGITSWISAWKRNGWRTASKDPVKNRELWTALDTLQEKTHAEWEWIRGHAGHEYNERCDAAARGEIAKLR